jgi:hypothetical protein
MDEIQEQVEELRGLEPQSPVQRTLLTRQQLLQRIEEDFLKDLPPEEARNHSIVLAAFDLLEPGFDLIAFYTHLYAEQVAGYYDHEEKVMVVIQEEGFKGPERLTYAHEYMHVLQDQSHDLENGLGQNAEGWGGDAYVVYLQEATQKTVLAFSTVWDTIDDAREYAAAFRRYATTRFNDPVESKNSFYVWQSSQGYHTFHLDNRRTTWILAVDAAQAESIWQAMPK